VAGRPRGPAPRSRPSAAKAAPLLADAERIANFLTDDYKVAVLSSIAQAVATTDPDRAERIVSSITDEYFVAAALSGIAQAVSSRSLPPA